MQSCLPSLLPHQERNHKAPSQYSPWPFEEVKNYLPNEQMEESSIASESQAVLPPLEVNISMSHTQKT